MTLTVVLVLIWWSFGVVLHALIFHQHSCFPPDELYIAHAYVNHIGVTQVNSAYHPSGVGKSSTGGAGWGQGGYRVAAACMITHSSEIGSHGGKLQPY